MWCKIGYHVGRRPLDRRGSGRLFLFLVHPATRRTRLATREGEKVFSPKARSYCWLAGPWIPFRRGDSVPDSQVYPMASGETTHVPIGVSFPGPYGQDVR